MPYKEMNLNTIETVGGILEEVPYLIRGWNDDAMFADPAAQTNPPHPDLIGKGYWRVIENRAIPGVNQTGGTEYVETLDIPNRQIIHTYAARNMTAEELVDRDHEEGLAELKASDTNDVGRMFEDVVEALDASNALKKATMSASFQAKQAVRLAARAKLKPGG